MVAKTPTADAVADDGWISDAEWLKQFRDKTLKLRVPVSGMLELTSRCNLQCVHCYLGPQEEQHRKRAQEMSTDEVKGVIDEFVAAGCMFLTITGGDPMMRKDFSEIYRHAKTRGLLVCVYCDGILVTDAIIDLFKELPPLVVEVSLYGATETTYETVTRVKGSYQKALGGIRRLLANGIQVGLKTVLMSINKHEIEDMEQMAHDLGVKFRFDAAIFPCLPNSDKEPLKLRVSPDEVVAREMSHEATRASWMTYFEQRQDLPDSEHLYTCGAAVTGFYVDPYANLSPCVMSTTYRYSLKEKSFRERWQDDMYQIREKKGRADYTCGSCQMRSACTACPAFNALETGEEDVKSQYICDTTQIRYKAIQKAMATKV